MKIKDLLKKHIVDAESFKVIEDQHNGLSKVVMEKKNIAEVLEMQELLEKEVAEVLTTNTGEIEVWVDAGDSFYDKTTISILKKRDKIKNAVIDISLILATLVLLYCKTTLIPGAEKNTLTVNITEYDVLSLLMVIGLVDRKLIRTSLTCILTIFVGSDQWIHYTAIGKLCRYPDGQNNFRMWDCRYLCSYYGIHHLHERNS